MTDSENRRSRIRDRLAEVMQQPEERISLAEAALLIAANEYPDLDATQYIRRLDAMADTVGKRIGGEADPFLMIERINQFLFQEEGFSGNTHDYYDPRNSFLNEVLDRKTGIPITLSTLYLEMAGRLNIPLVGVGMPGHFLVKHPYFDILIDPFDQGRILSEDDCRARMQQVLGDSVPFDKSFLDAADKRQIVTRMLNNLRGIYVNSRQYQKALDMSELVLAFHPDSPEERKQRAALLLHLRRYSDAVADLNFYLEHNPGADDVVQVRQTVANLRNTLAQMN